MSFSETKRIANYHYDRGLSERECGGDTYIIGFACAYNAYGLIGSECNGIFILNDTKKNVVLDEHMKMDTGYFGREPRHSEEIVRLCELPESDFRAFVRTHPRARDQYR